MYQQLLWTIIYKINKNIPSEWNKLRVIFKYTSLPDVHEFWQLILDLLYLFQKYDCRNGELISDVLHLAWRASFYYGTGADRYFALDAVRNAELGQRFPSEFNKIFYTSYTNIHQYVRFSMDAVRIAAIHGQVGLLEILFRYGAVSLKPFDDAVDWDTCTEILKELFPDTDIANAVIQYFHDTTSEIDNTASRKRLIFVIKLLEALTFIRENDETTEKYISSISLFFEGIPEPFITTTEVYYILKVIFKGFVADDEINGILKEVGKYFPASHQLPGPRSLLHLCRCQTRENLRLSSSKFRLPQVINTLQLPKTLRNYISFQEETTTLDLQPFKVTPTRLPTNEI